MDIESVKKRLQNHFSDGLVVIIGSGLSSALGLPSMRTLANYLVNNIDQRCSVWDSIVSDLTNGVGLEDALTKHEVPDDLLVEIIKNTADCISTSETEIFEKIVESDIELPFYKLLEFLPFDSSGQNVVTTNYDRLIEIAVEKKGIGLNSSFVGETWGEFNPAISKDSMKSTALPGVTKKTIRIAYRKHVNLFKPHGSLDWYLHKGEPVKLSYKNKMERLMITPGASKYKLGYDKPFDYHREQANKAIQGSTKLLILGYGFNDPHLEVYLRQKIETGTPTLLLTRTLSSNALQLRETNPNLNTLSKDSSSDADTEVYFDGEVQKIRNINLWDLSSFLKEVFKYG